ncbi:MAG: type II secretion system protein N [Burkholderiales bacterium]
MSTSAETSPVARMEAWHVPIWLTPRVAKTALWSLIFAWTAWLASQWIREALAPQAPTFTPVSREKIDLERAVNRAAGVPLFGEMSPSDAQTVVRASTYAIKLKGVIAGGSGPMVAIVNTGGERDELVQLQTELSPGVVLKGVYPTHVVISRNGVEERVELEALRSGESRAAAKATASNARRSPGQEATAVPAEHSPAGKQPESRPTPEVEPTPHEREPEAPVPGTQPVPKSLGMSNGAGKTTYLTARIDGRLNDTAALFTSGRAQLPG